MTDLSSADVAILREQSKENLEKHIQERLPLEYQNCMTGIDSVIRMACDITEKPIDDKTRLQALSLLNECYKYKIDLTTNGVIITDASPPPLEQGLFKQIRRN